MKTRKFTKTSSFRYEKNQNFFKNKSLLIIGCSIAGLLLVILICILIGSSRNKTSVTTDNTTVSSYSNLNKSVVDDKPNSIPAKELYDVASVVDGDTIKIVYQGTLTSVRLIGVNTPETVDPRKNVECFGVEASNYLKNLLSGKKITIESDPTQSDRDKYNRLLRYVYLDGMDINLKIISDGYGYEYTYNIPYNKQQDYKNAQKDAEAKERGLWAPSACANQQETSASTPAQTPKPSSAPVVTQDCRIKGNISSKGEKIYHVPGQRYYNETIITPSKGERMFCTEQEAVNAGWRRAKV